MYFLAPLLSSFVLASNVLAQQDQQSGYSTNTNSAKMKDTGSSADTMPAPSGTTTSAGKPFGGNTKVHVIKVSDKNGSLTYSPSSISVPVGEMVQWHFYPKNHSVVQAAFSNPCEPVSNVMPNVTTFFSGYMPVKPSDSMLPALSMMVKTDKPFWYYCSKGDHCQDGMVGVINP